MRIEALNVSKSFDRKEVLTNIALTVPSGEIVCLIGPSGAGKTTLIRLFLGAIAADAGTIEVGGTRVPDFGLLKRIGYMPQNDAVYPDLTGEQNLRFFGGLYGLKGSGLAERVRETAALVDLKDDLQKYVGKYSGGMKKRLSLAIALLHGPDVLILDEPTVGIDPLLRRTIWSRFRALKDEGKTLVVSTHVMDEFYECDRAALLSGGRLLCYDTREGLLARTENGRIEDLFFTLGGKTQGTPEGQEAQS
jgi:ABC-2 type transport system ATP-binding protein